MKTFSFIADRKFAVISPWLLACSIGILTLIIVIFAANNLRREINLLNNGLFLRGQSLAGFVAAGTRASMMQGMQGARHTQSLIEQAAEDPNILYIAVIDKNNRVVAHNDAELIGTSIERSLPETKPQNSAWHVVRINGQKAFEVISDFAPFRRHRLHRREEYPRGWRRYRNGSQQPPPNPMLPELQRERLKVELLEREKAALREVIKRPADKGPAMPPEIEGGDWCQNFALDTTSWQELGYKILVGLDMSEQARVSLQGKLHIAALSAILLLVGLGSWVSLLIAQHYSVSQKTLKHIQAFANLLVVKLPVGVIATDQDGTINTFNKAAGKLLGIDPEKALGKMPGKVLPEFLKAYFENMAEDEEVFEREIVLPLSEDEQLTAHVSSVPIVDNKGDSVGRVLLLHDLTELKKLEKEVRQHDRLVALGKMAAGVAHEVRNPLSSIKGFATLLGAHFKTGSEEHKAADLLVKEVERLNRSITELLNYARPLPLKKAPVDLKEMLSDSLQFMSSDAKELGVETNFEIDGDLNRVLVDKDRLNQVLLNLYLNAFQAMENGGSLTVRASNSPDRKTVVVVVSDTGAGIAPDIIDRITDPYFTTKSGGTGLGLALVYKIIDEHGGRIRFKSEEGKGTKVFLELPTA